MPKEFDPREHPDFHTRGGKEFDPHKQKESCPEREKPVDPAKKIAGKEDRDD